MLVIYNDFYTAICTVLITFMLVLNVVDEETIAVMFDLIASLGSMVCNEGCSLLHLLTPTVAT